MTTRGLFPRSAARPSFFAVARAMGERKTILEFHPSDAGAITARPASVLREVERLGGGRHARPIELVSHAREPERSIS